MTYSHSEKEERGGRGITPPFACLSKNSLILDTYAPLPDAGHGRSGPMVRCPVPVLRLPGNGEGESVWSLYGVCMGSVWCGVFPRGRFRTSWGTDCTIQIARPGLAWGEVRPRNRLHEWATLAVHKLAHSGPHLCGCMQRFMRRLFISSGGPKKGVA